jgi:hypothetical protein
MFRCETRHVSLTRGGGISQSGAVIFSWGVDFLEKVNAVLEKVNALF